MSASPDGFVIGVRHDHEFVGTVEVECLQQAGDVFPKRTCAIVFFPVFAMLPDQAKKLPGEHQQCQQYQGGEQGGHGWLAEVSGNHWKSICRQRLVRRFMASSGFMAA